jgi:hypothetical protein
MHKSLYWKLYRISVFEVEAVPSSFIPSIQIGKCFRFCILRSMCSVGNNSFKQQILPQSTIRAVSSNISVEHSTVFVHKVPRLSLQIKYGIIRRALLSSASRENESQYLRRVIHCYILKTYFPGTAQNLSNRSIQ